jgi:hypothetical protein
VLRLVRRSLGEGGSGPAGEDIPDVFATASRAEWRAAAGWMAAFFLMFWLLGALVTVPLFALVYLVVVSHQSAVAAGVYALVSFAFIYGLFVELLHIPLPPGALLTSVGVW